jgi:hypothetical protein
VLAATAALDADRVVELLAAAVEGGLVGRDPANGWRFVHTVVRDVIYWSLPIEEQRRLHGRALAALDAVAAPVIDRAWHVQYVVEPDDLPGAVALLVEAGQEHLAARAHGLAVMHLGRAVELGEQLEAGTPAQARRLLLLGEAYHHLGHPVEAHAAFRTAAQYAGDDPELLAAATIGFTDRDFALNLSHCKAEGGAISDLQDAMVGFGDAETPMRVQLMARLALESNDVGERKQARSLAVDAVAMARRVGDPVAFIMAAAAHHQVQVSGGRALGSSLAESASMLEMAFPAGNPQCLHLAHRARFSDLLLAGDLVDVDAELLALGHITRELGAVAPYGWWVELWLRMRALSGGNHVESESTPVSASGTVHRIRPSEAEVNSRIQTVFLRREQGRLAELGAELRAFVIRSPYSPETDTLMVLRAAELDDLNEATDGLRRLVSRIDELREDRAWGGIWFQLARITYLVKDRTAAALLYELGQERSGQCVVIGDGAVWAGAADLALAWLAETLDEDDDAVAWYSSAEAINVSIDARAWLAQTRLDHARLLARRDNPGDRAAAARLAEVAAGAAGRIGLRPVIDAAAELLGGLARSPSGPEPAADTALTGDPSGAETAAPIGTATGVFRRAGSQWELDFAGQRIHLHHAKGLADIARLLAQPGRPLHVSELVALQSGAATPSGADEVFDARARQEIRQRLVDLKLEADDAEDQGDLARAERARAERAELLAALSSALGLGGRARRLADPMEKARKTVTARIRATINRIDAEHKLLARHLGPSIHTGLWCVYDPEQPVEWRT